MRHLSRTRVRAVKIVPALAALACVAATALTVPVAADAASRNFQVRNESSKDFVLRDVDRVTCRYEDRFCHGHTRGWYDMEFEGRAKIGSPLSPGGKDEFELKYYFTASTIFYNYAADLVYDDFMVRITTTNYTNGSQCWVYDNPKQDFTCHADGTVIRIEDR